MYNFNNCKIIITAICSQLKFWLLMILFLHDRSYRSELFTINIITDEIILYL